MERFRLLYRWLCNQILRWWCEPWLFYWWSWNHVCLRDQRVSVGSHVWLLKNSKIFLSKFWTMIDVFTWKFSNFIFYICFFLYKGSSVQYWYFVYCYLYLKTDCYKCKAFEWKISRCNESTARAGATPSLNQLAASGTQ